MRRLLPDEAPRSDGARDSSPGGGRLSLSGRSSPKAMVQGMLSKRAKSRRGGGGGGGDERSRSPPPGMAGGMPPRPVAHGPCSPPHPMQSSPPGSPSEASQAAREAAEWAREAAQGGREAAAAVSEVELADAPPAGGATPQAPQRGGGGARRYSPPQVRRSPECPADASADAAWARTEMSIVYSQVLPQVPGGRQQLQSFDAQAERRMHPYSGAHATHQPPPHTPQPCPQQREACSCATAAYASGPSVGAAASLADSMPRPQGSAAAAPGSGGGGRLLLSAAAPPGREAFGGVPQGAMPHHGAGPIGAGPIGAGPIGAGPAAIAREASTDSVAQECATAAGARAVLDAAAASADAAMPHRPGGASSGTGVPSRLPLDEEQKNLATKWRVASRTVAMFSRRAAAGLAGGDEPLNDEEEAAIAELTSNATE